MHIRNYRGIAGNFVVSSSSRANLIAGPPVEQVKFGTE